MPLIVESFRLGLPGEVKEQLGRLYKGSPEFSSGDAAAVVIEEALQGSDSTLYTGVFNARHICAILAQGKAPRRQLRYLCVHPANRGRGIARRLFEEVRRLESAQGITDLEAAFDLDIEGVPEMLKALGFAPGPNGHYQRQP